MGENRQRLLQAGLAEFGLHGFHGAATAAIAARADVPQPHLYASFSSKQALFAACVGIAVNTVIESAPDMPPDDALRVLYQAYAAARDPALQEALSEPLCALRERLSADTLAAYLLRAADSLVSASDSFLEGSPRPL